MKIESFITELADLGLTLSVDGDNLKINYPAGLAIPGEILEKIKSRKEEVIDFISGASRQFMKFTGIPRIAESALYDVSHAQRRILLLAYSDNSVTAYNSFAAKRVNGKFDFDAFRIAIDRLVARHESMRTVFVTSRGEFKQRIVPVDESYTNPEFIDLRAAEDVSSEIERYCRQWASFLFDLDRYPLFRFGLLQIRDDEFVILLSIHHIISDGWSLRIFVAEVMHFYKNCLSGLDTPLPDLGIQYKDFAYWHNSIIDDEAAMLPHKQYWLRQLDGIETPFCLMPDYSRPMQKSYRGCKVRWILPAKVASDVREMAIKGNCSLYVALLASVKALLFKYTQETDITVGTSIAGREHPSVENQIGFYVNTLPLRTRFLSSDKVDTFLQLVCTTVEDALDHQIYPFDLLVDQFSAVVRKSYTPFFSIKVVLQNMEDLETVRSGILGYTMDEFSVNDYECDPLVSIYDLCFRFTQHDTSLRLEIEYDTDIFKSGRISQMYSHLSNLMSEMAAHFDKRLCDLEYMTKEEKQVLFNRYYNTTTN